MNVRLKCRLGRPARRPAVWTPESSPESDLVQVFRSSYSRITDVMFDIRISSRPIRGRDYAGSAVALSHEATNF